MSDNNFQYVREQDAEERLMKSHAEGYASLTKWIISLSAGAILLTLNLINPEITSMQRAGLTFGLGLLVISILCGVYAIRLGLEFNTNNLNVLFNKKKRAFFEKLNPDEDYTFIKTITKVRDIIKDLNDGIAENERKMKDKNRNQPTLYNWQHWLFFSGIILITFFVIFKI